MSNESLASRSIQTVIARLHEVRRRRDLSYDAFAVDVGISRRNLFRVMNERTGVMHDRTLQKLLDYLDRVEAVSVGDAGRTTSDAASGARASGVGGSGDRARSSGNA